MTEIFSQLRINLKLKKNVIALPKRKNVRYNKIIIAIGLLLYLEYRLSVFLSLFLVIIIINLLIIYFPIYSYVHNLEFRLG